MNKHSRLYLVRHGQVEGYDRNPVYGHTDVGITQVGKLQMESLSERLRLADIGVIYSSDLKRSVIGAQIIARYHDVPHHIVPELREMYFGTWEGMTLEEIHERFTHELRKRKKNIVDFKPPGGGESFSELSGRVSPCFREILEKHQGENILLVGHGGVNRIILCEAMGLDFSRLFSLRQDYGCLNVIDFFPDTTVVRLMNG
ncbi:MAG: histidine phosphatase family protein [Deltaproteobacteria bacterium]|nr:histidine phosphatase family protein [Deltaproteobacteria bacterium]MBW2017685.1 histidine phosphatase family protein [Deltaproteobacteria bacterium]MBW2130718.1 histidine phosphatase family protein [Deltaproteobacteria bacterium]